MAKNNIKPLNQDYDRLVEVLDATDDALKVKDEAGNLYEANLNKIWTTSVDVQTDESGVEKYISKISPVSLENFTEYQSIKNTTDQLNDTINNEEDGMLVQLASVNEQLDLISNIIGDDYIQFNINPIPSRIYSVVFKNKKDLVIKYKFKSVGSTGPTGPGVVTWQIGNQTITETIQQNTTEKGDPNYDNDYNVFDFSQYAHVGANKITGTFDNQMGSKTKTIEWTITAVDLSLNIVDFRKTKLYDDSIPVKYQVNGLGENDSASVFFQLDQAAPSIISFSGLDVQKTFTIPKQSHGSHLLSIHAEATIGGSKLVTDKQFLDLMCIEEGQTLPIIRWPYDESLELEQYTDYDFEYSVYDPQNTIANIKRHATINYIDNNEQKPMTEKQSWTNTANWGADDEQSLIWKFTPEVNIQKGGNSTGTVILSIECGEGDNKVVKTKTFTLKPSKININPVTDELVLDFNPKGRTNQDIDYNSFIYENKRHNTKMSVSDNFNWTHGGWQKDEQGQDVFVIKTGSRMFLDYPLFAEQADAKTEGRHIKITYKATNCASFDAPVMSCREYQGKRHVITPEEFYLKDGEIKSKKNTARYFIDGYNLHDETDSKIWKDGLIGDTLVLEDYDKDERDENGLGFIYHISCADSYIGLALRAQEGILHSSYNDLPLVYCEDEKMSLSVDIEKSGDSEARLNLMTGYIDADPIRIVQYDSTTSFKQKEHHSIEFGSDECDVLLYRFKVFTRHLENQRTATTINEVFNDYIADIPNAKDRLDEYDKNDFLNTDGTINITTLQEKCPGLRIVLITCPKRFTIDKDDKVKGCTVEHILAGSNRPEDHWIAENVQLKGQGTSSNAYGTSARNMDIKLNKLLAKDENGNVIKVNGEEVELDYSLVYWDENGEEQHAKKYSMTDKSIAVNYFNIKVNVASSENANNACLADWFNEFNPYKRAVKTNGVRDTMEFHPCAIFIREGSADEWVEFEPEYDESNQLKYHFYACGDFGNSKKNHDAFGMGKQAELDVENAGDSIIIDGVEYPLTTDEEKEAAIHKLQLKECIVEFSNNTHPVCLFEKPDGWDDILPDCFDFNNMQVTQYANFWSGDAIEFRYPEDVVEGSYNKDDEFTEEEIAEARERLAVLQPQVQRLWRWVESVDPRKATNEVFTPSVQLAVPSPVLAERVQKTYDADTAEYRKAKFLAEYKNYFEDKSMLFHYLFTDRYLMIDNRVKNVFLHTTDGLHWDFCFNYDDDTSLGCENSGFLTLDYNLEDCDKIKGIDVYNGNSSVLWENVRTILIPELKSMYNNDACKDAWSSSALLGKMTQYQAHKPILLEMIDMYRKYIRPYKIGHGWSANKPLPTSEPQYLERMNGRKALQRKRFETYRDIYTGSKYQSASFSSSNNDITFRIATNGSVMKITPYCDMYPAIKWGDAYFTPTENKRVRRNETCEISLESAGDKVQNQELHFCGASMLSDLGPLAGFQVYEATFNKGTKLKRILLGDHTGTMASNIDITTMSLPTTPLLEEVDVSYTQYKNALNFKNQPMIKTVYCENSNVPAVTFAENGIVEIAHLNALSELNMNGLTKLKDFRMVTDLLSSVNIQNTPYLTTGDRAISFIKTEIPKKASGIVDGVDIIVSEENMNMFDKYIVNGDSSSMEFIGKAYFDKFYESMKNTYDVVWPKLTVTFNKNNYVEQHAIEFQNYDGTVLATVFVDDRSETITIPYEKIEGLLKKPETPQYTYTFSNWSPTDFDSNGNYIGSIVREDRVYVAEYLASIRQYNVTFNAVKDNQTRSFVVDYGTDVDIPNDFDLTSYYDTKTDIAYSFKFWDGISSSISEDTVITAQWDEATRSTTELTPAKLLYIKNNEGLVSKFEPGDRISIKMGANRNFNNINTINIIEQPTYFDGKTCVDVLDSKGNTITLTDADQDWTILVEYKPLSNGSLFGWSDFSGKGVSVGLNGEAIISSNGRNFNTQVASYTATGRPVDDPRYQRDVVVLAHKKDSGYINVYECAPWALQTSKGLLDQYILPNTPTKLTLGGRKKIIEDELGRITEEAFDYGIGIIYDCKLWFKAFSEADCKELVKWTSEEISFDVAEERSKLVTGKTFQCNLELITSGALHFPRISDEVGNTNGKLSKDETWNDLEIYNWLNERVYKALPVGFASMLYRCDVPSLQRGTTTTAEIASYCWLPSLTNILTIDDKSSYTGEDDKFSIMTNIYSTYRWRNAWASQYFSGNTANIKQVKDTNPAKGDMYLSPTDFVNNRFNNIEIYNDLEWNTQFAYNETGYGPCYWLRTPHSTQPCLGFLHRDATGIDYDGNNPARAVVFCVAI